MASSSASRVSKYDVFLSFRGEDTRQSIVSHLYEALARRGLVTFKDDKRLEIGDHISDELQRAIQGSDFFVVVLSENYATSRWCLMELQLIMELPRHERLRVLPVFYGVEPSAVRYQQGSFDLQRYYRPETADKVLRWRQALNQIAGLSGVESRLCIDEASLVWKISDLVSRRKTLKHNIDSRNIVGEDTHMEGLKSLLDMDSKNDEVLVVGIWGMGGIGKTTIAKCLYGKLSLQFEASYFTGDIKGIYRDRDLIHLQENLLYSTLSENISLWSVEAGHNEIKDRLGYKSVLLVLDGVDKVEQVHALAKETRWFGPGSRIIITTRDRGLLKSCGVKAIYEVKCLDDEDSLKMFKQIAFETGSPPPDDFEQVSIRASRLGHGLPSAIRANALFLRGRANSLEEWEEAVCGIESAPDEDTMKILKLSYEGLAKEHQKVFLDVACLFNGETYQRVISLLDGHGTHGLERRNLCIRVLAEKSLIKITTNGYVNLHKFVEQMAREIMLDCRKLIGDLETIQDTLVHGIGAEQTECISLHTCELTYAFSVKTRIFARMRSLKFLKVYKHVDDRLSTLQVIPNDHDVDHQPHLLRLFHWDAFPLTTLPLSFDWKFLVELNLRHSNLETLWSGALIFENLKRLDVTGSKKLRRLPDLPNIEELILEQCTRLEAIPRSIGYKSTLRRLNLSYNGGPKRPMRVVIREVSGVQRITLIFPTKEAVEMELVNVSIAGDIEFDFLADCEGHAEYLSFSSEQKIPVTTTPGVQQAPPLISEFNKFKSLHIRRFSYNENGRPAAFHSFPDILGLKELKLINLNIQILPDGIGHLEFLENLDLSGNDFEYLPEAMSRLPRLKTLWLRNCSKLQELPELTQVQSITLFNCRSLKSLVKLAQDPGRYCLLELCLDQCKNVKSLSYELGHFTELTYLDLGNHDFETLPSSIRDLTSLITLCLNNCKKLRSVEVLPQSLQFLEAQGCDSLEADAFEHFEKRRNKKVLLQPRSACFQETEMPSCEVDHQATKSRLPKFLRCSYF